MNIYKEGATLGVSKIEYIVSTGTKQVDIGSKYELENYLKLDKLKPLSTSYTQNDNSTNSDPKEQPKDQETQEDPVAADSDVDEVEQNKGNTEVDDNENNDTK